MMYFQYTADAVTPAGKVIKSLSCVNTSEEHDMQFHGRNVSAALLKGCGYNYGNIEPLQLNTGPAPKGQEDYAWLDKRFERKNRLLQHFGDKMAGWMESPPSDGVNLCDRSTVHWCEIDWLLAQDYQRIVFDVRGVPGWQNMFKNDLVKLQARAPRMTLEEFIGEDFLLKIRTLKQLGYTRFTCWTF